MSSTITNNHDLFSSVQGKGFTFESKVRTDEDKENAKNDLIRDIVAQAFTKLLTPIDEEEGFMGSGSDAGHFMDFLGRGIVEKSNLGAGKKIASPQAPASLLASSGMFELLKEQGGI